MPTTREADAERNLVGSFDDTFNQRLSHLSEDTRVVYWPAVSASAALDMIANATSQL